MEVVCKASTHQSTGLEKTITVLRGNASLGMTVSALRDGSGISIRSVVNGGAISKDGRLKVGDGILALNGETATNLTNAQARAMLRRHSLIGPELSVTYVPAAFLDMHRAIQSKQDVKESRATAIQSKQEMKLGQATVVQSKQEIKPGQATVVQSKQEIKLGQATVVQSKQEMKMGRSTTAQALQGQTLDTAFTKLGCNPEQSKVEGGRVIEKSCREREKEQAENTTLPRCRHDGERKEEQKREARGRTLSPQARGWRKEETERETEDKKRQRSGHPRRVTLIRTNGESLGISVTGGRGMGRRLSNGEIRRGIFIKYISEHSPAARDNTLTPGDQILQVC
ncbi:multiple PDZ domain protein [Tachysurus ichikawai]